MEHALTYDVLTSEPLEQLGQPPLPDGRARTWSPISSTLISGERDAVLVDPPMTLSQADDVAEWVERSGKHLRAIYLTHGHADHWFGGIPMVKRFPDCVVYATEGTRELMVKQNDPAFRAAFWDSRFPGLLPEGELETSVVPEGGLELEGHRLFAIEAGHSDTDATTMLHVPSIGLLVAGDVVYNEVHLYLAESGSGGLEAWLAALDLADSLEPRSVVAGHKNPAAGDDPQSIEATRAYLVDARDLLASSATAEDFYAVMLARHPGRINDGALWGTAVTFLPRA